MRAAGEAPGALGVEHREQRRQREPGHVLEQRRQRRRRRVEDVRYFEGFALLGAQLRERGGAPAQHGEARQVVVVAVARAENRYVVKAVDSAQRELHAEH